MRFIDLTHTFDAKMPVYPGDPESSLTQIASIEKEGFSDHELHTAMHVGTHMDAPLHMIEHGMCLSEIPVERFLGKGHLIDAQGHERISGDLLDGVHIERGDIVLIMTGFSRKFRSKEYYTEYPELTSDCAERLVACGISIVGMDTPSPDRPPFPVHKILLGNGILIIENLTNLEALLNVPTFTVSALPMKLAADAAPVRVVAIVS